MNQFIFTRISEKQFYRQEKLVQEKIIKKLQELKTHTYIFSVLKTLTDFEPATHRLRIGDYRIILEHKGEELFLVLAIGHRREVYK